MASKNIWFRLGHAFERARHGVPAKGTSLATLRERAETARSSGKELASSIPSSDDLVAAGLAMVVDRVLGSWGRRTEPGVTRLLRAAVSGAAAALIVDLIRPLLEGDRRIPVLDRDTFDHVVGGAAHGLVYGAVLEPRVPGPPLLKGIVFGSAEYMAHPLGGVTALLGHHAPHRRLPVIGDVIDRLDDHDRGWLEYVAFGIALAVIYESSAASSGILSDDA